MSLVLILCAAVCSGAWFLSHRDYGQVKKTLTIYPQQYSDRTITKNAINKDERFTGLSFADPRESPKKPLGGQLASIFDILRWLFLTKPHASMANEYGA